MAAPSIQTITNMFECVTKWTKLDPFENIRNVTDMLLLAVRPLVCIEQLGSQCKDFRISDIGKRFEKL